MTLTNTSQTIPLAKKTIVSYLVLTGGTIIASLWLLRTLAHANAARQTHRRQDPTPSSQRGAHLRQVYPTKDDPEEDGAGPDIDIIAIHGLDTNSEKTWTWKNEKKDIQVNWLSHSDMLPKYVGKARIFTYDWPGDLLQPSDLVQKTQDEFAVLLFQEIRSRLQITSDPATSEDRPILFIASCLGGIVLMKALVGAGSTYQSVRRATRGIIFLATPFRGTSFQDVAALAEPGLNAWAWIRGREVIKLLTIVKEPTLDLVKLVQDFTSLCQDKDYPCQVSTFYEKGKTSLPSNLFPWLPAWLRQEKLLVNESSAALDMVSQPLPLSRPHILMNKFAHSNCTDECKKDCTESVDFGHVSGKIVEMLQKIRQGSPLEQADAWIRTEHYTQGKLNIERLSGEVLPMDRCYINLAIVRKTAQHGKEGLGENASPHMSPFSLTARLNVETPDENVQMELPSLFDPRKDSNGQTIKPRRIFIRGRAGVGKTTLCKKMASGFPTDEFRKWNELFDRVLWVPLRRLKEWSPPQYDLEELFSHEFFAKRDRETRAALAKELRHVVEKGRTLFILDGVDEIAQELARKDFKSDFLKYLLDQPNVVITSRPHVSLPANVRPPDVELETIGFYPVQVEEYLKATFTNPKKVEDVQSYLKAHQLIQDLVRIPIQLDALCYTWDNFDGKAVPQTMTAIYKAIEESLWKKDVLRLGKRENGELVTKDDIKDETMDQIENLVESEVFLLEGLAFTGLRNDVINFGLEHRKALPKEFKLSNKSVYWDRTLPHLSFLRTSDPSEEDHNRDYHFLHLTFQEYFAARYFVRQWKAKQPLHCLQFTQIGEAKIEPTTKIKPTTFLQEHKYDPRYDIFWRFVAGLLDADGEALGFFQAIVKEPRDLLGPTHQRLVMHCLSEVERKGTTFTELRPKLEKELEQWLLFECESTKDCWLAREIECPEQVFINALKQASEEARVILLESLGSRAVVPSSVIDVAIPWLEDCASKHLYVAILRILTHQHTALQDTMLQGVAARLEHEERDVREAAVEVLQGRADLTEEMLQGIAAQLEHEKWDVRRAATKALQGQADLTEEMLQGIAARLEHKDWDVQLAAIKVLQGQTDVTEEILRGIAARLEHKDWSVRLAAIRALVNQAVLSLEVLGPYVKPLYNALIQKSFKENVYWYASDGGFIGIGLRHIPLNCKQEHQTSENIWEIWTKLGVPLSTS
ncbi:hypothetical protein B0J11DRAFT_194475 [Dendryphion nanum]|uniref:NACHT domain-containing protein n=1 Tax=Dendryphion nanum TaxID=256645 RepID=A0A9P9D2M0_9PLEO|nr:hypothetical protein B0J11DRAFT_194475 [Dendryphion nanum]